MATTRRVIVLCDGTWCGRETNTKSNIYFLAKMIGVNFLRNPAVYESSSGNIHARYFDGVGLDGDFMSYIWNGAFATQARKECTEVYKFVANNFASNPQVHTEVWMFGISRGAYIVRSVAGMINNCGIIEGKKNKDLIDQAYDIYRSPYPVHEPQSAEMIEFREKVSYKVSKPPIKFMGLFDTVGSRGVPKLNYHTGTGFEWPEFYDTNVSSEVEKVYHAVATHDRFWAFQPCLVSRNSKNNKKGDLEIHQKWFPGCHYDIARQEFQFLREGGSRLEKILFPILNMFSKTIVPNEQLADLVLLWVLESIETTGGGEIIQHDMAGNKRDITRVISDIKIRITSGGTGTGDIYEHILSYLPGGNISFLVAWFENFDKTAYAILFKPRNRVIPDPGKGNSPKPDPGEINSPEPDSDKGNSPEPDPGKGNSPEPDPDKGNSPEPDPGKSNLKQPSVYNEVYNYTVPDPNIRPNASGTNVIETSAKVNLLRYPSETYQNYCKYMEAVGRLA